MRRLIKFLSKTLCLVLAVLLSVSVVACNNNNKGNGNTFEGEIVDIEDYADNIEGLIDFGTHKLTAPESEDKWLVKDGVTEYKLVVPTDTSEAEKSWYKYFVEEFVLFFKRATNIVIPVVYDTALPIQDQSHNANQHYISLDETTLFKTSGLTNTVEELTSIGGKIWTVDNNVYITGWSDRGTLNAVYTFLMITFNWEVYSSNTIEMDEGLTDVKLRNYQVVDIPDSLQHACSDYERSSWGEASEYSKAWFHTSHDANMFGIRMRIADEDKLQVSQILHDEPGYIPGETEEVIWSYVGNDNESVKKYTSLAKLGGHNSVLAVPMSDWQEKHPEWYSEGGVQLCYTCNGNEESYDELTSRFADMIKLALIKKPVASYPLARSLDITIADSPMMCVCSECSRLKATYKDSGLTVRFFNTVAEKVRAWMDKTDASGNYVNEAYRRPNLEIRHYAYLATEEPPAMLDSDTGEWVPIDDTVVMHENTCIKYANINTDYQQSLFAPDNAWARDGFDGWAAVTKNIGFYTYSKNVNIHNYFYDDYDHFNTKGMNYYLANGRSYYYSGDNHGGAPTEFGALGNWLQAKLCYNSLYDSGKLTRKWFKAVYGPVAGIMMELFNNIRVFNHNETVRNDMYKRFSLYNQVHFRFDWKETVLDGWIGKCDQALAAIEHLKETDYEEWSRIAYNVELEVFSPIYIQISQNKNTMPAEKVLGYKNRLINNMALWPEYTLIMANWTHIKTWVYSI